MELEIGGFQSCSLIDYPGHPAAVVFMRGCNMRCPYCHNRSLVWPEEYIPLLDKYSIIRSLADRRRLIDGVVLTGGEALLQPGLASFAREIRDMGLKVKLDTNGTLPEKLKDMLPLVDAVAMDLKTTKEKYEGLFGVPFPEESLNLLKACGRKDPDKKIYFRTTRYPGLTCRELAMIKSYAEEFPYKIQECIWEGSL